MSNLIFPIRRGHADDAVATIITLHDDVEPLATRGIRQPFVERNEISATTVPGPLYCGGKLEGVGSTQRMKIEKDTADPTMAPLEHSH